MSNPIAGEAAVKVFPRIFYQLILFIVKYTLKYVLVLCTFLTEFRRIYSVSTRTFRGGLTIDHLQRDLGNLSKLPKHLSFVINEDVDTDYFDLVNLVLWTIAMGIPYITIYERHGLLKAGEFRFREAIGMKINEFLGCEQAKRINVVVKDSQSKYENGKILPKQFCVQLLSEADGREDVAIATKSILSDIKKRRIKKDDITVDKISSYLRGMNGLPDPDLIVQFGKTLSLEGYPPWQTRLSEIVHIDSHKHVTYGEFYDVLCKFSRCQQRLGK